MRDELLSVSEAAAILGCSRSRVQQAALRGEIKGAFKVGPTWVIPARSLRNFPVRLPGRPRKERAE